MPRPVWQGRIGAGLDPRAKLLNDSLPVDRRLWPEELALSRAYAQAIAECGVLSPDDLEALLSACDTLEAELLAGAVTLAGEDVHSAIEDELAQRCGEPARRLHTGRSRNDQVVTLLRMRVMRLCEEAIEGLQRLERALLARAKASGDRVVAAYTHMQPAQPVLLAQWWLAYVAALERDEARFGNAREAADLMPLGSGAVAGSPLRYDRALLAGRLGFSRLALNSLDAVGDRDFALEYLQSAASLGVHLSRLGEDLVLWCSPGFGWYRPGDGFATGSSLLPQKRNPDLFELARGKSARLISNAERLAIVLKGLPSAYQKDLQADKETLSDTAERWNAADGARAGDQALRESGGDGRRRPSTCSRSSWRTRWSKTACRSVKRTRWWDGCGPRRSAATCRRRSCRSPFGSRSRPSSPMIGSPRSPSRARWRAADMRPAPVPSP
jgi:argininosuccinate lyase